MTAVSVSPLATGRVREKRGTRGVRRYVLDRWSAQALPVNAFLIRHPAGLCLFDTGQTARATRRGWFPWWHPFFRLSRFELEAEDEVATQLRSRGIAPAQVSRVLLSHLHTDHVGGLDAFTHAEVLVPRVEWKRATGLAGRIRGYLPQHWPPEIEPTLVDFDGPPLGPFAGTYDVAGDGRLLLVPTPGHTPGHSALVVRAEEQTWLLAGDMVHSAAELDRVDAEVAAWCRENRVAVLPAHDPEAPLRLQTQTV